MGMVAAQKDGWALGMLRHPLPLAEPLSLGLDSHCRHPLKPSGLSSLSGLILCGFIAHGRQCLFAWERLS